MTTVFTDRYRTLLYASLDQVAPIDPSINLMTGKSVHWVFFRTYAAPTDENDTRYTTIQTIAQLSALPGWGTPLAPNSTTQVVGTTTAGSSTFCIANNPFAMGGGWASSTVVAAALVLEGTYSGTIDPVIYITDTPFAQGVVMDPTDTMIARPSSAIAGNRPLFSWPVFVVGSTTVVPTTGSMAVLEAPPAYELAYTRHCWIYPQRVNFIANPSFELGTNHWRTSGAMTRVQGTAGVPAAPGGGAWFGRFTGTGLVVAESNIFPMATAVSVEDTWTVQAMVRGTGKLRIGLISWEPEVVQTSSDWGDSEVWDLPPSGFLHVFAQRHAGESTNGLVRFESTGTFEIDNVLAEPDWLKDWQYFDGDSTYGARDDFSWYGGESRKGQTYSTWYNHKRAVTGRLFAWDIDSEDFVITDEEVEAQGFVYKWVPAGVRVTPHLDVLYPSDIQETVSNNAGTAITPYKTGATDFLGVVNPWAAGQYLSLGAGTATTPDTANMTIAGRVRLTVSVRIDTVTAGQFPPIVGKYPTKREYMIYAFGATNGLVSLSTMQPDNTNTVDWIIRQPFPYGERHTYGSEFTPGNSGVVVIYDDTRASLTVGSLPTPPNTADPVTVGFASYITGRLYWAQLETLDGAGNVTGLVWRFDPTEYPGSGTVFTDPRGRVWTLTSAAAISRS